ncbi:MAG: hypothetical protein ACXVZW_07345, partial [Gaiellaceae bacterium]
PRALARLPLRGTFSDVAICCQASVLLAAPKGADVITALDPGTIAYSTNLNVVLKNGRAVNGSWMTPGTQVTVRGTKMSPPKRFVPTRQFWK